jgi:2,5-diketo-D-gluconate reductase A
MDIPAPPALTLGLADCMTMPLLGMGTWRLDDRSAARTVATAIDVGYRLIDTASYYENERGVGRALSGSGISREELFVTSKIRGRDQGFRPAERAIDATLRRLRVDYIDLMLVHWPLPSRQLFVDTWRALIEAQRLDKVRSIGVSNFDPGHLETLRDTTGVLPVVNQIQCNPKVTNDDMRLANRTLGIVTQAWEPLGAPQGVLDHPVVRSIGARHAKSAAQVVLRWHLQLGHSVIPKSSRRQRLEENAAIFDWCLEQDDVAALSGLDAGPDWRVDPAINDVD